MRTTDFVETLRGARWFSGKNRAIASVEVVDRAESAGLGIDFVDVRYAEGAPETYLLVDGLDAPGIGRALLDDFTSQHAVRTERGGLISFRPTESLAGVPPNCTQPVALMRGEQSNTSLRFGDALLLKLFRRVHFGPNPDVEIGRYLTEQTRFRGTPAVAGSVEYEDHFGRSASLALLQCFEHNRGDAWRTMLARLDRVARGAGLDEALDAIGRLGLTTADLHIALAEGKAADFSAEPIALDDVAAWRSAIHAEVEHACRALGLRGVSVATAGLDQRADGVNGLEGSLKTRHHGDYHLGQVLERLDGSFAVIDFEGEPSRPLAVRREKRSPLRDVAGMLRSLDYARHAARAAVGTAAPRADDDVVRARLNEWYSAARSVFVQSYLSEVNGSLPGMLPLDVDPPLAALELEKAAYEVMYELNNRPDWLPIPLAAFTALGR